MADPGVLNALLGTANRLNASPKVRKALIEAGIVESGLRNLPYGDKDSLGVLQERTSIYGRQHALSPTASAERFVRAAQAANHPGESAGTLAQAVQRSAFPARYDQQSGAASQILGRHPSTSPSGGVAGGGTSTVNGTVNVSQTGSGFDPGPVQDSSSLLGLLGQPTSQPYPQIPQAPQGVINTPYLTQMRPQSGLAQALSMVQTPQASLPADGSSSVSASVGGTSPGASAASVGTGRSPVAASGALKLIGSPYQGTHTLGNWQSDRAYDIAVPKGTPMVALQDGTIVKVTKHPQGAGRFAGDQITVQGANGNQYFYAHGVSSVQAGQKVRKGQQLGVTGAANGVEHLHFAQMKGDPSMHLRAGR